MSTRGEHEAAVASAVEALREAAPRADEDPERPAFHFRPPAGWMNDPTAALHQDGRFHLFYQHNPYADTWGRMHWGHAWSPDLVRWHHLPPALAPETERGEAHCYTGSAWRDARGETLLFYTSVPPETDGEAASQRAVRASPDLTEFRRASRDPVLSLASHGGPRFGPMWRDPFVFEHRGRTFLLLGATLADGGGAVVPLYEAEDGTLLAWAYRGLLLEAGDGATADGRGRATPLDPAGGPRGAERQPPDFYECPNLLDLGDRQALLYSAHRPVAWMTGRFDPDAPAFRAHRRGRVDHGPNFYATSRLAYLPGDRERTVVVGWIRGWSGGRGWNGALSLPREVRLGPDGRLRQRPLAELASLRGPCREVGRAGDGDVLSLHRESRRIEDVSGRQLEVRARLRGEVGARLGLRLLREADGRPAAELAWRPAEGELDVTGRVYPLDPARGGIPEASGEAPREETVRVPASARAPAGREEPAGTRPDAAPQLDLHLFLDRSVLELFADDGRACCTRILATGGEPMALEAFAEGGAGHLPELRAWALEGIW